MTKLNKCAVKSLHQKHGVVATCESTRDSLLAALSGNEWISDLEESSMGIER